MARGAYREGQWTRREHTTGGDSYLHGIRHNNNARLANIDRISLGTVFLPQPEPLYRQHAVSVQLVTGGLVTNVAWPGAQINANASGTIPGGVTLGIHGLWESPLPGQMVLMGYVDGSSGNPIVINKYPYNSMNRPDLDINHTLPLTLKAHGATDVILGHHTGSFIALRGTLPLPAAIDITSLSIMNVTVATQYTETVGGAFSNITIGKYEVSAGAKIGFTAVGKFEATGLAGISLTSGIALTINATPNVVINSGTRPVAANQDLTLTSLGLMPITATGTSCLVP